MTTRTVLTAARSVLGRINRRTIREQLLTIAGANRSVLRDAPKERTKQVAMGAVLLSTAAIASVSASYALYVAVHLWVPFAVIGGLAWGLIILNLDRWLVVSTPRLTTKLGTLAMALPRVLLAILIGAVISTPLTLAVFSSEINAEVKVMAAEKESAFTTQLQNDSRYKQLPEMQKQIQALQDDLAHGVTDADVMSDPAVVDLQHRLDAVTEKYDEANAAVLCEEDGTCGTHIPGIAAAAEEKVATRDRLAAQVQNLQSQLTALKPQVRQQLMAQDGKKSADERVQLAALQTQVADTQNRRDAEIAAHREAVGQGDGILARLTALGRIQDGDSSLATAHLMLFLFMTALECLPIIFKTMLALGPPSLYERLVLLDEEKLEARIRLRMQTEYEEAETMARSALTAAEARAARILEAESKATGMVLNAQLSVTREGVRRWRDEQLAAAELDALYDDDLEVLDGGLAPTGKATGR